jgi:hypothetical protein
MTEPNVLRLTDSEGRVLATLTLPCGTWNLRVLNVGEPPATVYGDAIILAKRPGGM